MYHKHEVMKPTAVTFLVIIFYFHCAIVDMICFLFSLMSLNLEFIVRKSDQKFGNKNIAVLSHLFITCQINIYSNFLAINFNETISNDLISF